VTPDVSVVVPTYKRPDLLRRCVEALTRQDLSAERFEIVVADDANDDRTRAYVEFAAGDTDVRLRYVPVTNRHGPAAARNAGWRAALAPIIAFTDDDCLPDPAWLREGLSAFRDGVAAVKGRLVMPLPDVPTDYELNASGLEKAEFVTANCFCRRSYLEAVGGFDEQFTRAWREDSDLQFRLLKRGAAIIDHAPAKVVHPVRPAAWGVSLKQQRNNLFEALLYKKHPELYRTRLNAPTPWLYYGIVATAVAALGTALRGHPRRALGAAALWAILTADFTRRRLRGTSRHPKHVAEMMVTSALIPPVALYWRLRGAARYKVPFL
jgi:glycosyltransferase involved in cell wall biosynthesis